MVGSCTTSTLIGGNRRLAENGVRVNHEGTSSPKKDHVREPNFGLASTGEHLLGVSRKIDVSATYRE
jgi:hypothetical protein